MTERLRIESAKALASNFTRLQQPALASPRKEGWQGYESSLVSHQPAMGRKRLLSQPYTSVWC